MPLLNFSPQTWGLLGDTLTGVGMGLLNQRPGEGALSGLGSGLQYAQGLTAQRKASSRADEQQKIAQAQLQIAQQTAAQQQQAFQQQQQQLAAQKAAAQSMFGGGVPASTGRPGGGGAVSQPNPAFAGMDPAQLAVMQQLAQVNPGGALDMAAQQAFAQPEAPKTREIMRGNTKVFQEFDTKSGKWNDVGSGPAFAPQQPKTPDFVTLISPDGSGAKTLDVTTPQGVAQARDLIANGFIARSGADPNSKPYTEDQAKTSQLLTELIGDPNSGAPGDYQIAMENFDALKVLKDQVAGKTPEAVQAFITSPEYQRAKNAVAHIIANNLYSLSGAAITDDEAQRRATILMPVPGESDASMMDKQNRIAGLMHGMKQRGGRAAAGISIPAFTAAAPKGNAAPAPVAPVAPIISPTLPKGFD